MRDQDIKQQIQEEAEETLRMHKWLDRINRLYFERFGVDRFFSERYYHESRGRSPEDFLRDWLIEIQG